MHTMHRENPRREAITTDAPAHITEDTIRRLTSDFEILWNQCPPTFPGSDTRFTQSAQRQNSRELDALISTAENADISDEQKKRIRLTAQTMIYRLLEIDSDPGAVTLLDAFGDSGDSFIDWALEFDPAIKGDDIYQALRNAWIFNSLQSWSGRAVACTPSCCAYSLLYPYTDNILDSDHITKKVKRDFASNLGSRLRGGFNALISARFPEIDCCIRVIETEFPRDSFPHVYDCILAIHHAQEESLHLQDCPESSRLQPITIAKGGTSVLADGSLVEGWCSDELINFCFAFGALLQLVDDMQDAEEDRLKHHSTIFSRISETSGNEKMTNRLLQLTYRFLEGTSWPEHEGSSLKNCFMKGCWRLILESIARHPERYTAAYVAGMEAYSPISFTDLAKYRSRCKAAYRNRPKNKPGFLLRLKPGFKITS